MSYTVLKKDKTLEMGKQHLKRYLLLYWLLFLIEAWLFEADKDGDEAGDGGGRANSRPLMINVGSQEK